jgi:O-antigen ligase
MPSSFEAVPAPPFRAGFEFLFLAGIAVLPFIAPANIVLALAFIAFLGARIRVKLDAQGAWLLLYALFSFLGILFAAQPERSAPGLGKAILFLIFPMAAACYGTFRERRGFIWIFISQSILFSAWGLVEYIFRTLPDPFHRIHGPVSHYMTYSGILMVLTGILLAYASRGPDARVRRVCLGVALLGVVPIFLSLTRNAWLGLLAILIMLAVARRKWVLPAAGVVLILLVALLPGPTGKRFRSISDPSDATNRDRLAMWKAGIRMVQERPATGLGMGMAEEDYARFRQPGAVRSWVPHLHSNVVQIAAERGIPALAAYLGFVAATLIAGWRKRESWRGLATLLAASGTFIAGFFEFNFGLTVMFWHTLAAAALHHTPASTRDETAENSGLDGAEP